MISNIIVPAGTWGVGSNDNQLCIFLVVVKWGINLIRYRAVERTDSFHWSIECIKLQFYLYIANFGHVEHILQHIYWSLLPHLQMHTVFWLINNRSINS